MKKRIFSIALICALCFSHFAVPAAHADPPVIHEISNCDQLQHAGDGDDNGTTQYETYVLTSDINCSGIDFVPLVWNSGFKGTFDGQGHTIYNLTINQPSTSLVGMFLTLDNATISNVTFKGGSVTGLQAVGTLTGNASGSTINNVHSDLDVTGTDYVGGLIGEMVASDDQVSSLEHASSSGTVSGQTYVGGLVGLAGANAGHFGATSSATIQYSFATGDVHGTSLTGDQIGGLVGGTVSSFFDPNNIGTVTINDSFASGDVSAFNSNNVGGLIGETQIYEPINETLGHFVATNTYATGDVTGDDNVGGLIGNGGDMFEPDATLSVSDSFAVGQVSGSGNTTGGLIGMHINGDHDMTGSNNYWDDVSTGQANCGGGGSADLAPLCIAVSREDAPTWYFDSNFPTFTNWDFDGDPWFEHASTFPTLTADDDFDGVDTSTENGAPNDGDGNNDGTLDSQQANVSDLHIGKGDWGTVALANGARLDDVSLVSMSDFPTQDDPGYDYDYDFISFSVVLPPHASTFATIIYHTGEMAADLHLRKYNTATDTYADVPNATFTDIDINGDHAVSVTYIISDGDAFDSDGSANGIATDPVNIYTGGPTVAPTTTTPGATPTTVVPAPSKVASAASSLPTTGIDATYVWMVSVALILAGAEILLAAQKRLRL